MIRVKDMGVPARDEPVSVLGSSNFRDRTLLRSPHYLTCLSTRLVAELAPAVGVPNPLLPERHPHHYLLPRYVPPTSSWILRRCRFTPTPAG